MENLVAVHLHKACLYWTDAGYDTFKLHYIRDKEKRETDFLVTKHNKPWLLIEVKLSALQIDPSLHYFQQRLQAPHAFQLVSQCPPDTLTKRENSISLCSASRFLAQLP